MVYQDYCPGCSHGLIQRIIWETLGKNNLKEQSIGVYTNGCSKFISRHIPIDFIESPPGKAASVATGIKRSCSDKIVFTYQGDGDITTGLNSLMNAAIRGEKITVIFVNNCIQACTGGQMSLNTLVGQYTATTPYGRSAECFGKPARITEMVSKLPGVAYTQRISVHTPSHVKEAKIILKEAYDYQLEGKGLSFVEILALCPTYWAMTPLEARQWLIEKVIVQYPLGLYKRTVAK